MHNNKTSRINILLIAIIFIGATSCHTYKNLVDAPQADTAGLVRDSAENKGDTTTIANIPWKEYFTDAKLQALITEGLDKNYNMQIALSRISQAEVNLSMARGAFLPAVNAGAAFNNTLLSSGADGTKVLGYSTKMFSLGFTASWEADLWGKLSNQSKSKYASYLSSIEYKNLVQTNLVSNIAIAYYNLMALDKQLKITKETIVLLEKSAQTMAQLKEAGQQNAAAVEQSNALLYSTQLSVFQLESLISKQENAICILLGRVPGSIDRDSIGNQTVSKKLAYGVPAQFLAKRPDVKQAEYSFRSAYAITNIAKANFYPSFTIGSAYNPLSLGVAGSLSSIFKPENIAADIVAGLSQPIFNRKQLKGNLKIAQAQQEEALMTFKYTVLTAGQEVSDILFSYKSSINKNELRSKQIESLTNAESYTQDLLMAGEANYTEVLSAQQSLLSAQLNQVNDKLEQLNYSVSLYKALGGGTK
jgi:NodT family efflux transporter outer membrane factor (OMF) lipoprotein